MALQIGGLSNNGAVPKRNSFVSTLRVPSPQIPNLVSGVNQPRTISSLGNNPGLIQPHQTPKNETPVKKTTTTDTAGNTTTTEYHKPAPTAAELEANTTKNNQANYGAKPPTPIDSGANAQRVINTGAQTPQEQEANRRLYQAGQMTPQEQTANEEVARANELQKSYQNVATLSPYAEAGMFADRARTPAETQGLIQAPDLAARASATRGLLNNLGDIYGSSRVAGANAALQGIQTAAGRGLSAAQSGLTGAQTQAQRAQAGAETVLGAGLPGQQGTSSTLYNPLEGAQGGGNVVTGANRQSAYDLTQQANEIQSVFNGAEANFKLLVDTAKQGGVNDMNIPAINAIQQSVAKGLASSSAVVNFQNTLATVRSQYAQILGGGTATVDSQNRAEQAIPNNISLGALQSLEQQLKAEATNRVAGIRQQVNTLQSGSNTSNIQTGGTITTPTGLKINPNF